MPESIAVIVSSGSPVAASTALDLIQAATMMEMVAHVYIAGDAIRWLQSEDGSVLARLRDIKDEGPVKVYACSRAMAAHGISRDALPPEVDQPAGFAFFLGVASESKFTLNF